MDKRVIIESIKAFSIGAVIGLIIMYLRNSENFATPFICGIVALGYHARNNTYNKLQQNNRR
jgi:hypothetical protein